MNGARYEPVKVPELASLNTAGAWGEAERHQKSAAHVSQAKCAMPAPSGTTVEFYQVIGGPEILPADTGTRRFMPLASNLDLPDSMWAFEASLEAGIRAAALTGQIRSHLYALAQAGDADAAILREACITARIEWVKDMVRNWHHFIHIRGSAAEREIAERAEVQALLEAEYLP